VRETATAGSSVVVALCRSGFEPEAAEDLRLVGCNPRASGTTTACGGCGYVAAAASRDVRTFERAWRAQPPIFVRSAFIGTGPVSLAARGVVGGTKSRLDRVAPALEAIDVLCSCPLQQPPWRSVWVEYGDTNEGKGLSPLARALQPRVEAELTRRGLLDKTTRRRLHVFLVDGTHAYLGTSSVETGSPWPLGIPRLSMPRSAPSRATLKLAEAFATFLGDDQAKLLRPGMRAVDLGAAPGGWTWQLAQRGIEVIAVDNGPLKGDVANDPLVTHVRRDGLTFRPHKPVDWLVCDIVMQPIRIGELVANWLARGDARRAIFNLKLPMKKRYDEVRRCEGRIRDILSRARQRHTLMLRQLYHDREEVTGYLVRLT
jgi:23S rRNA (cytidine2498-2'-O)-methyltransferase